MGIPVFSIKSLTGGGGGGGSDPRVSQILEKIPAQATAQNQLADKDFVNSSIGTNTANYISNQGQPFTSVAQLPTTGVTNNDYAFVTGTDSAGNAYFDRYKATVSGSSVTWAKEYRLNNSSFTAEQWAAITSGITSALVAKFQGMKGVYKVDYATAVSKRAEIVAACNDGYLLYMVYNNELYICDGINFGIPSFSQITKTRIHIENNGDMCKMYTVYQLGQTNWSVQERGSYSRIIDTTLTNSETMIPNSKAVYDALALKANASDVKAPTAFTCEMADGTTKTLTLNGVLV